MTTTTVFEDLFNRADGAVGNSWSFVSGAAISSNTMQINSSITGQRKFNTSNPLQAYNVTSAKIIVTAGQTDKKLYLSNDSLNQSGRTFQVLFDDDANIKVESFATTTTIQAYSSSTEYTIEAKDIDYTERTFDLYIDTVFKGTFSFNSNTAVMPTFCWVIATDGVWNIDSVLYETTSASAATTEVTSTTLYTASRNAVKNIINSNVTDPARGTTNSNRRWIYRELLDTTGFPFDGYPFIVLAHTDIADDPVTLNNLCKDYSFVFAIDIYVEFNDPNGRLDEISDDVIDALLNSTSQDTLEGTKLYAPTILSSGVISTVVDGKLTLVRQMRVEMSGLFGY